MKWKSFKPHIWLKIIPRNISNETYQMIFLMLILNMMPATHSKKTLRQRQKKISITQIIQQLKKNVLHCKIAKNLGISSQSQWHDCRPFLTFNFPTCKHLIVGSSRYNLTVKMIPYPILPKMNVWNNAGIRPWSLKAVNLIFNMK